MKGGRIYLLGNERSSLVTMNETNFLTEDRLQAYLADYPDLLPGDQIDPERPRRWLLVKREMGVPDAKAGEAVKVVVVKKDPAITEADIRAFCEANLTGYKRPKVVEFRTDLPKTTVGKILRRELREARR